MSLFRRGKAWWMQFYLDGVRYQESTRRTNRRQAENYQAARRLAILNGEVGIKKKKHVPTFAEAMKQFLTWSETEHSAHPNTHKRYKTSSKALLRAFGKTRLDAIGTPEVEAFKVRRSQTKGKRTKRLLRPASVNRELACLRALFSYFIRNDSVLTNPVSKVKFLTEDNEQNRVLTCKEQDKYLGECSQPLRDVAAMMLETGMRPEEIYRLRVENVNVCAGWLFNPYGKTKAAKRKIPLTTTARAILRRRTAKAKGPYVFGSESDPNKPITQLANTHQRVVKRTGLPWFRLYDLRHTFATRAAEAGVDLITLAALLGHSRIVMVQRYAHPGEDHKADAIKRLEQSCVAKQAELAAEKKASTATPDQLATAESSDSRIEGAMAKPPISESVN